MVQIAVQYEEGQIRCLNCKRMLARCNTTYVQLIKGVHKVPVDVEVLEIKCPRCKKINCILV